MEQKNTETESWTKLRGEDVGRGPGEGAGGELGRMADAGGREWLGCYYSSWRVGTQSAARRAAHCAAV